MQKQTRKLRLSMVSAVGLLALGMQSLSSAAQPSFNRLVVFGTSLSDPGNFFALHHINNTPPYTVYVDSLLVPSAAYAIGGHHLSNGTTWIEQLAQPLGLAATVRPAFASSGGATNYAVDQARAYNDGINVNLQDQVTRFTNDVGGVAPSSALYVMEMGSNDVRDVLQHYLGGDTAGGNLILQDALASIAGQLQVLYAMGARHFLIWNVPDISLTPTVRLLDEEFGTGTFIRGLALTLTTTFNGQLALIVGSLESLPGIDVKVMDAFSDTDEIVANKAAFGLTDVQDACIMPGVAPFRCQIPDKYLFWDGLHPTQAGHAIIAHQAAIALGL
jgi:phospholipase/lecithinase/hemolysin